MAKGLEIKRRIKSTRSTLKITKAMELISSVKMKKASQNAVKSKDFVTLSWQSISRIAKAKHNENFPLFTGRKQGKVLLFVITADKGLAGSYNSEILKRLMSFIEENKSEQIDYITIGNRGTKFIRQLGGNIIADFRTGTHVNFGQISPVGKIAWDGFNSSEYKSFSILYSEFKSIAKQGPVIKQILPVPTAQFGDAEVDDFKLPDIFYEPKREDVLFEVIRFTIRAQVYQSILEAEASEHAARMIAMKNASDAAKDLADDLQFTYNQLRQSSITAELAEISAGRAALE